MSSGNEVMTSNKHYDLANPTSVASQALTSNQNLSQQLTPRNGVLVPPPTLASSRYNRQLLIPSISLKGQQRLSSSKVLIIGLGGLGSPAALYLAGAGVHTLGLLDDDEVELSNLHRQIVHRESSVTAKLSKVESAIRGCKELNSEINYEGYKTRLSSDSALDIIGYYDVVLDCTDNPATRYLISDACVLLGKVLVSGAAQRTEGQLMVLNYPNAFHPTSEPVSQNQAPPNRRGPCYRCVFPRPPSPEMVRGCGEIGILGTVVGVIGTLMAGEAIKFNVQGPEEPRKPTMLLYNAWSADPRGVFRVIGLRGRRSDCISCGDDDILRGKGSTKINRQSLEEGRIDYQGFCGIVEDLNLLEDDQRIEAGDFLREVSTRQKEEHMTVIDVREDNEFELGTKVQGSLNIPISKILRKDSNAFEELAIDQEPTSQVDGRQSRAVYFVCQRGNDSQIAAQKLMDRDISRGHPKRWIGDVVGGFIAMEKVGKDHVVLEP